MKSTLLMIPNGSYQNIINTLGKWKLLDSKSLHSFIDYKLCYQVFMRKLRNLEGQGMIKSFYTGTLHKHLYLTELGIKHTPFDNSYELSSAHLTHDLICVNVLKKLTRLDNVIDSKMFHQISGETINPDAEVTMTKEGRVFHVAVEVELTQKSQKRIKRKFSRYTSTSHYDYALFITNKPTLYRAYKRFIQDMTEETQGQVVLVLDETLKTNQESLNDSKTYFNQKERPFFEMFTSNNPRNNTNKYENQLASVCL